MQFISPILALFSIVMSLVLAYFLGLTDFYRKDLDGTKRTITVVILVVYAVYRSFRLYKDILKKKNQEK